MDSYEPPSYPAIAVLIRFGRAIAIGVALLPLLGCLALVAGGSSPWLLLAGALTAPVLLLLLLSYVEMARIIADTLMPR